MRKLLKPLSFIPAILLMCLIFNFSSQSGDVSGQLSFKVSCKIVEAGDYIFDANLEQWQVEEWANKINFITRKLAHMTEYFALAVAVSFPLYVYGLHGIWLMLVAGIICVGFALGDEYHQSFVGGRSPSLRDVGIDSIGVFFGIVVVRMVGWTGRMTIFKPRKKKQKVKRITKVKHKNHKFKNYTTSAPEYHYKEEHAYYNNVPKSASKSKNFRNTQKKGQNRSNSYGQQYNGYDGQAPYNQDPGYQNMNPQQSYYGNNPQNYGGQPYGNGPQQNFGGPGYGNGQQQNFNGQNFGNGPQQDFGGQNFGNGPQQDFGGQNFGNGPQQDFGGQNFGNGQQQDFNRQNFSGEQQQNYSGQNFGSGQQQDFGGQNFGGQQQNFNSYRSDQDYANYRSPDDFEDQTQYYDRHQQYEAAGSSDPDDEYRTGNKHSKHFDEDEDDDVDLVSKIRSLFNRK
ncbi:VanZ family protein [uncultured Robinsoniella sp.]|uniref:VanZ family protein n=1 Tax=uncultured Robinsoniella sp. TaxID=904190 RepID=UPI00374E232B